ncbi:hypothetical protein SPRG_09139 [Saprolegnia parasitica CBS 223.65]|uniref:Uncharacterized protein n=1 Tax=Saprolegnia parasitica (strain CBS 223.65) TaxID=695850 RepID=A0A067C3G4_SAPPC|nr:hypothetical protein SPRG_09139 [Saprolegnia parasitica CBS 223.65]KDO25309.1 hypothetical protein SPRG_09139 [Saprolegnia parasitica CBS 223.65]|eukprot:XP_012203967.1 hypothetical protein SPRG_09139 [Saprolegnia parasitica CBS 223.65]
MAEYGRSKSTASKTVTLSKPSSMNLYAKVCVNDRQHSFVAITPDNDAQVIASMWTSLQSRANGDTTFQLYVYVEKRESKTQQIRRATDPRIRKVAARGVAVEYMPLRVRIGGQQLVLDVNVEDFRRIANVDLDHRSPLTEDAF